MSKREKVDAIGFPPPLLGDKPYRLKVLEERTDWLVLEKPADIGVRVYPWDNGPDLDRALNSQLKAGKPELTRREVELFGSVYYLDPEISGAALFAKNKEGLTRLKNIFGSGEMSFTFYFVSAHPNPTSEIEEIFQADAPLLPHNVKPKMIPSSAKGKKSFTTFERLSISDKGWDLWKAKTTFFRPHQVRAHAATYEIPVLGDALYRGPSAPSQKDLHPSKQRGGIHLPSFFGIALHLAEIRFEDQGNSESIDAPLPKHFRLMLKRMGLTLPE